ncbi:1,4-alpha-glucan branching protein GlgB [Planococcus shenhongbingii]|uniref:1,4-alpha-glucan branching protein GlgB n=1 Tax=Planococcus shenhongbingii TaxID=3058398 RepID=UPI00261EFEF5|nr:1,4-alpha-glucan branching protein GlgB [Planococcus sp. N016]WKA58874.1 1,4-alpha-glucan branching protein GlgB [Planococcus sp. N016]
MSDTLVSFTPETLSDFHNGKMIDAYLYFGSHIHHNETLFAVWVPDVKSVAVVIIDPQELNEERHQMAPLSLDTTIWEVRIPEKLAGFIYEYEIETADGDVIRKTDPFARANEKRPQHRSIVSAKSKHVWSKAALYQKKNIVKNHFEKPMAIYEVHIGTWKRNKEGGFLTYRELAAELIPYVKKQGFTHIELLPITEHPLDESWGYQTTGFFAPTSRYGTADDLKYFIAKCAENSIGLISDWVPGHFCVDTHALASFNGTDLYEEKRPERRSNPDWGTLNFDVQKGEVVSFILSSAHYWFDEYKFDGCRMDALVNLLFIPNRPERPHNEEGAAFLRILTTSLKLHYPEAILIAEDAWHYPKVTGEVEEGGIGFHYKWNFGMVHDAQAYMKTMPSERSEVHRKITFSMVYYHEERYISTFSHDELIPEKGSLLGKMPGTLEEKFHQLRLLLGFWIAHPGKKLLFMGQEFGHFEPWDFRPQLDWHLFDLKVHRQMALFTKELLTFYKKEKAFFELDYELKGFEWLEADNSEQSVISFIRRGHSAEDTCIVVCNFSDLKYEGYQVGLPAAGVYQQIFSTADAAYGGPGNGRETEFAAQEVPWNKQRYSMEIELPAFTMSIWKQKQDGSVEA